MASAVAAVSFENAVLLLLQSDLLIISARGSFKERDFQRRTFQLFHYFNSLSECLEFTVTRRREAESFDQ